MPLLFHWTRKAYEKNKKDWPLPDRTTVSLGDEQLSLHQNNRRIHDIDRGDAVWAFTRNRADRYVLAAELTVDVKDEVPDAEPAPHGRHRVTGPARFFDVDRGADLEPLIRSFAITVRAATLGTSFQGSGAVKSITQGEAAEMAAFAAWQILWGEEGSAHAADDVSPFDPISFADERERIAASVVVRAGQPVFRQRLIGIYGGRCVISGCAVAEVLEAAHIVPYRGAPTDDPRNGLLLRADLHSLFDLGLLRIDPDRRTVQLADRLRASHYGEFHGRRIRYPNREELAPSSDALRYHHDWAVERLREHGDAP